jgi:hypothetical protein
MVNLAVGVSRHGVSTGVCFFREQGYGATAATPGPVNVTSVRRFGDERVLRAGRSQLTASYSQGVAGSPTRGGGQMNAGLLGGGRSR